MKVGFIGVGSMGSVMVPHLVKAGHTVSVWNRTPEEVRRLEAVSYTHLDVYKRQA